MSDFLLGVPGRLKVIGDNIVALLNRWTQAKADFIDAAVSSRAPSSTALSSQIWTTLRAAYLDQIPVNAANITALLNNPALQVPTTLAVSPTIQNMRTALTTNGPTSLTSINTAQSATPNTYVTIINEVGAGVIEFLGAAAVSTGGGTHRLRVTIDSNVFTFDPWQSGANTANGKTLIGALAIDGSSYVSALSLSRVPFKTAFKVETSCSLNNGSSMDTYFNYYRTP